MNTVRLDELETAIRGAVARGAYSDAQRRLPELRSAVEHALQDCPADGSEALILIRRAGELLRWALRTTQAA